MNKRPFFWNKWILLLILWLAVGLRFHRLTAQSFWNDEGNSARLSERPIPLILEGTASDIHPPLYYLVLHGWRQLAGEDEWGLRSLSAFIGVLTVAATAVLARQMTRSPVVTWLAAGLTAVHPALIYYSQETRMYALLALLTVLANIALARWLDKRQPLWAGGLVLACAAGLYTHYFFPAVLLSHGVWVLWHLAEQKGDWFKRGAQWAGLMLIALALYAPWLPIFLRQTGGRDGLRQALLPFLQTSGRWLLFGATVQPDEVALASGAALVLLLWGAWVGGRRFVSLFLALAIPVLFMEAAGATEPQFFKFMLAVVPFVCLALAWGAAVNGRSRWLILPLVAVLLWGDGRSLTNLYHNPAYARADYRGMAERIAQDHAPNAGIILDAPNQWEVFTYYHKEGAPVYPIPKGAPNPESIAAELSQIAAQHTRLYALFWGEAQRDPQRLVESWLDAHAFKAQDEWVGDVRLVMYAVPAEPPTTMAQVVNLPFGEAITLLGYTLTPPQPLPGDVIQVTLFWQTAVPLTARYKVFLHLVDESGQLVAQRDSEPGGGLNLTSVWPVWETILDNHGLLIPADAPNGRYTLLLGLYAVEPPNGRLPITTPTGPTDAYPLEQFQLP